jgi:chromosome segregation ATPase
MARQTTTTTTSSEPAAAAAASKGPDIETLKQRHAELDRERTTAKANLANATRQLAELKAEAKNLYGTDDLDALRVKLQEMREQNERKRAEYQRHLEEIEAKLTEVDRKFGEVR